MVHSATAALIEPEEQRGAHQAQVRDQDQREQQRRAQRAQVVEGQDVRDDVLEVEAIAQDPHQQRDLEPDQDADDEHHAVEHDAKAVGEAEGQKENRRREAADQAHHQLDQDETAGHAAHDEARQAGADAHREQIRADDRGELRDAVAQQVAGQRARDQLVDEPAGGDQKNGNEQSWSHCPRPEAPAERARPRRAVSNPREAQPSAPAARERRPNEWLPR